MAMKRKEEEEEEEEEESSHQCHHDSSRGSPSISSVIHLSMAVEVVVVVVRVSSAPLEVSRPGPPQLQSAVLFNSEVLHHVCYY
jgi:hypothetical protein